MRSRHFDPHGGSSPPAASPHASKTRIKPQSSRLAGAGSATVRESTGEGKDSGAANLIVTRELYKVLDQERRQKRLPTEKSNRRSFGPASRPNFLVCYLCGQQFSATSLPIHQPQCYVKKLIEWERMEAPVRGPKPIDPKTHEQNVTQKLSLAMESGTPGEGSKASTQLDQINAIHFSEFNTNMLSKCENCGRTFLPSSLVVHQRSCKPGAAGASKPPPRASAALTKRQEKTGSAPRQFPAQSSKVGVSVTAPLNGEAEQLSAGLSPDADGALPSPDDMTVEVLELSAPSTTRVATESLKRVIEDGPTKLKGAAVSAVAVCATGGSETTAKKTQCASAHEARSERVHADPCVEDNLSGGALDCAENLHLPENDVPQGRRPVTIPMNNVSRFKNVSSRLKLERQSKNEMPRCRYCNRTFNADRLAKHESVCLERDKPKQTSSAPRSSAAASKASKAHSQHTPRGAQPSSSVEKRSLAAGAAPQPPMPSVTSSAVESGVTSSFKLKATDGTSEGNDSTKRRFCFDCGAKLCCETQRFCAGCGTKLL